MFEIVVDAFENLNPDNLPRLTELENEVDECKRQLTANHFAHLAEGNCNMALSPYYSSLVLGLERVADHLVNVGYSILNPTGSQSESRKNN
jgi:phosphate:Na+ symporter